MNFGRSTGSGTFIPTSSMGDIAFLLLIFFMVTTIFREESGLPVELPRAEAGEEPAGRIEQLPAKDIRRLIRELERQMKAAADELEFEKAALLRDQVYDLRAVLVEKEQAELPAWERERRLARLGVE